jgi:ADP-heptose:LPS heptosyltransferase
MKTFLIVSRGWMGDTLLVSSLASLIKPSHPNSEITLMTAHPSMNEVLQAIPGVDKVINGNSFQQYDEIIDVTLPHLFEEDPITTYTIE